MLFQSSIGPRGQLCELSGLENCSGRRFGRFELACGIRSILPRQGLVELCSNFKQQGEYLQALAWLRALPTEVAASYRLPQE